MGLKADARSTRRGRRRWRGRLGVLALAALFLWVGGFFAFVGSIEQRSPREIDQADGIVVLTGGAERLNVAIGLLLDGKANRLLISGVYPRVEIEDLARTTIGNAATFECCVDLGRAAANTRGNAAEAAAWAGQYGYQRIIVVTANYHMPRSLFEMRRAMPDRDLVAYPVEPIGIEMGHWWADGTTLRILLGEYTKYLLALASDAVMPAPPPPPPATD